MSLEECPVCGELFPTFELEDHVNACLDAHADLEDLILACEDEDDEPQPQPQPQPFYLQLQPQSELPMLGGFRNESFGIGQSFNIGKLKRDGGVLYVNVEALWRTFEGIQRRKTVQVILFFNASY